VQRYGPAHTENFSAALDAPVALDAAALNEVGRRQVRQVCQVCRSRSQSVAAMIAIASGWSMAKSLNRW
jgi:hypothetical protein